MQSTTVLLGLGANIRGAWGSPRETLTRALRELQAEHVTIIGVSNFYTTAALGNTPQPRFLNAVARVQCSVAPAAFLRLLKKIERRAGRTLTRTGAVRPLDIDVLDFGGRRIGTRIKRRLRGSLILPHPEIAARAFVLVPLCEVDPAWRHPVLGRSAKELLARLRPSDRAGVQASP